MIVLKNIIKTDNTIEADFFPEGKGAGGYVKISLPDGKFLKKIPSPDYSRSTCAVHARYELLRLSKLDKVPSEKTVIWF